MIPKLCSAEIRRDGARRRRRRNVSTQAGRVFVVGEAVLGARTSSRELSRGPTAGAADALGLALAGLAPGEPAETLDSALAALKQAPGNTEARIVAALCCRRLNQSARAAKLLSAATGGNSDARIRKLLASWCED